MREEGKVWRRGNNERKKEKVRRKNIKIRSEGKGKMRKTSWGERKEGDTCCIAPWPPLMNWVGCLYLCIVCKKENGMRSCCFFFSNLPWQRYEPLNTYPFFPSLGVTQYIKASPFTTLPSDPHLEDSHLCSTIIVKGQSEGVVFFFVFIYFFLHHIRYIFF